MVEAQAQIRMCLGTKNNSTASNCVFLAALSMFGFVNCGMKIKEKKL